MALRGIKVLEFSGLAPVPMCGMILSDFGANVIRIDKTRTTIDLDAISNNKRSIAINLKTPQGVDIIKRLAKKSDVLIEPFRAGKMEKLDLGPDVLCKENPKLIYARLTGYGQSGPLADAAGHDINYLGLTGLLSLFGRREQKPVFPVNFAADFAGGGVICALGILLALLERTRSGLGQVIDSSMVEGAAYVGSWLYRSQHLPLWGLPRGNNILDSGAHFYDVYETKDGNFVTVGAIEPQFYSALLKGLGINQNEAPQYSDFEQCKTLFKKKFLEKTRDEWWEIFQNVDACVAPLLTIDEATNDAHNVARNSFIGGFPKPAPVLSRTPGIPGSVLPRPKVGEHTQSILEKIGYSNSEIKAFIEDEVVECYSKSQL